MNPLRTVTLTPPLLSEEHIQEKITCIRPHRERIFNTATVFQGDKIIFHNYGQGGAGWTFLFGCVQESLRQFEDVVRHKPALKEQSITVLGAGCYGLLTAIMLVRAGYRVRIIAREVGNLTSDNSAGFFFPCPRKVSSPDEAAHFVAMGMASYKVYQQIIQGNHPFIHQGPQILPAYFGTDLEPGFEPFVDAGLMKKPELVVLNFGNEKKYTVWEYHSLFINPSVIMQELRKARAALEISLEHKAINNFNELADSVVFNCTGLGSKKLVEDVRMVPSQGHLILLKNQPPADQMHYMINVKVIQRDLNGRERYELIYYAPKQEGILGITFIRNQDSLTSNSHQFDRLLERSRDFFGT